MKYFICLFIIFTSLNAAADEFAYNSSIKPRVDRIYWQPHHTDEVITYAYYDQFMSLREFIDRTLMTYPRMAFDDFEGQEFDRVYLSFKDGDELVEIFIGRNHFIFEGFRYIVNPDELMTFINHNQRRVSRGDLVLTADFSRKLRLFKEGM